MTDFKMTTELVNQLIDIERREDAGEDVFGLKTFAANRIEHKPSRTFTVVRGSTQKARALTLYGELVDKSRKSVIDALMVQLNMKKVTASTYASNLTSGRWTA